MPSFFQMTKSALVPAKAKIINLLDFDKQGLTAFFSEIGEKPFRASQLLKWVHQEGIIDFDLMTNFSKSLRAYLQHHCSLIFPTIIVDKTASDGTRKWVLQMVCGNRVETIFIPEVNRSTLCVSSQVGCALACTFCSTAKQGFNRNLSTAEIIGQLWLAQQQLGTSNRITNVVMMGMGEPLLNLDSTVKAINLMMGDYAYGLSKRRVTVSTSGVVPAMLRLQEVCDVSMAVSLHAATDQLRDVLVPINKKYPLEQLLTACKAYVVNAPRKFITFEYVMLKDVNDSAADARALIRLLKDVPCKMNLIPFNPYPNSIYQCSSRKTIEQFKDILHRSGMVTTVRKPRGEDIDAACGQLVGQVAAKSRRHLKLIQAQLQTGSVGV